MIPPAPPRSRSRKAYDMGYCSYGFRWSILATNRQIYNEARQVFYSENDWTFFVGSNTAFDAQRFLQTPLASGLPLIRRVHIRFRLFECLFLHLCRESPCFIECHRADLNAVCVILALARSLRSVKLVWTETAAIPAAYSSTQLTLPDEYEKMQGLIAKALQPLAMFQHPCPIQRSLVIARLRMGSRARVMELAFCNAVDSLIAFREARTVQAANSLLNIRHHSDHHNLALQRQTNMPQSLLVYNNHYEYNRPIAQQSSPHSVTQETRPAAFYMRESSAYN